MWIDDDQDNESGQEINDKDYVVKYTRLRTLVMKKMGLSIRSYQKRRLN